METKQSIAASRKPMRRYGEKNCGKVEDLDTDLEDHAADEWRYAMMSRPIAPLLPKEKPVPLLDPLDMGKKREAWHRRY